MGGQRWEVMWFYSLFQCFRTSVQCVLYVQRAVTLSDFNRVMVYDFAWTYSQILCNLYYLTHKLRIKLSSNLIENVTPI